MENYLNSTDDALIKNLDFSLPSSTNYIINRRSVLYQPVGSSNISHSANRNLKFKITGEDGWIDPATVRVQYTLSNTGADPLNLLAPALASNFFRRLRIISGQPIEEIDYYNRYCVMMNVLKPHDARMSESMEQFNIMDTLSSVPPNEAGAGAFPNSASVDFNMMSYNIQIPAGESRTVLFHLNCGLFNQHNFLPLRYMPLEIELQLCDNIDDPLVGVAGANTRYELQNIQLHADVLTLDSSLDNEFSSHILEGKTLSLHLNSFYHHLQHIPAGSDRPVFTMARAFTRLKRCYLTFYKRLRGLSVDGAGANATLVYNDNNITTLKECNLFWHPQLLSVNPAVNLINHRLTADADAPADNITYNPYKYNGVNFDSQVQVGGKLVPENYVRTSSEALYHLKKSLNIHHNGSTYSLGMTPQEYRTHKHIQAFDFQKAIGVFGSGISTKSGDLLTIKLQNLISKNNRNQNMNGGTADLMFALLEYDMIIDISDSGISVLD